LGEHLPYKQGVAGSSPAPPIDDAGCETSFRDGISDVAEGAMLLLAITDSAASVVGAVAAALILSAVGALGVRVRSRRAKKQAVIELPLSGMLFEDSRFRFGLLHVKDGRDQSAEQSPLVNTTHWFEQASGDRPRLVVSLRYTKRLGAQFKCFADYREMGVEEAERVLGGEEAIGVVNRAGAPGSSRVWFLLHSHETVATSDGFANNFIDPA
jgi:hypothetical protein